MTYINHIDANEYERREAREHDREQRRERHARHGGRPFGRPDESPAIARHMLKEYRELVEYHTFQLADLTKEIARLTTIVEPTKPPF